MVTLTERAGALLEEMQQEQGRPLRIEVKGNDLSLTALEAENAPPEDEILYHGETPVLRVAPDAAEMLAGCTIGAEETPTGVRLAISTP